MKQEHFRLKEAEVLKPYVLRLTFGDGEVMKVDLKGIINRIPALSPLKDPELFAKAQIDEWGAIIEWIPGEIDMAADNLRAEAVEQQGGISHERIWEWMYRNNLTLDTAAEALGISRRMVA